MHRGRSSCGTLSVAPPTVRSRSTPNPSRVGILKETRLSTHFLMGLLVLWMCCHVFFFQLLCFLHHAVRLPDLDWLWNQDASRDLLLAVHPPNYIVLWNGDTGTKLWKKSYAENILSFSFDPFDPSNMARKSQQKCPRTRLHSSSFFLHRFRALRIRVFCDKKKKNLNKDLLQELQNL